MAAPRQALTLTRRRPQRMSLIPTPSISISKILTKSVPSWELFLDVWLVFWESLEYYQD
jgi:hypothetical protein